MRGKNRLHGDSHSSQRRRQRRNGAFKSHERQRCKGLVRCSAYKVPVAALHAYWKNVYGDLDSGYACNWKPVNTLDWRFTQKVEVILLDADGEEISATTDIVPTTLLTGGFVPGPRGDEFQLWRKANSFNSFFVRPLFSWHNCFGYSDPVYSSEIQRDAFLYLTDAQLEEVKHVEVRFVGGKKSRQ